MKRIALFLSLGGIVMLLASGAMGAIQAVCHVPPGNPAKAKTVLVGAKAAAAHLKNHSADFLGFCVCQVDDECFTEGNECITDEFCLHGKCEEVVLECDDGQECNPETGECGFTCPCFDASDVLGVGIDFAAQVLPGANCIDLLPDAIELNGARGPGLQSWIANAAPAAIIGQDQCFFVDELNGIDNGMAPITPEQVGACLQILLASDMFALNNCPP